jgi:hypothetical protein
MFSRTTQLSVPYSYGDDDDEQRYLAKELFQVCCHFIVLLICDLLQTCIGTQDDHIATAGHFHDFMGTDDQHRFGGMKTGLVYISFLVSHFVCL